MATSQDEMKLTFRKFKDGENKWSSMHDKIFVADTSHKCPVYVHRTPPCQGSCPAGEDIRGWLQIVRGIEKPAPGVEWHEYAFRRATDANPFPAMMGRVCPAPCEDGCNRNEVEEFVGINSVEQFIGDTAFENGYKFEAPALITDKKVAIVGGGPAGMSAAYHLRRRGIASVIFDDHDKLGGMMQYGIPNYRIPRSHLEHEINRIIEMGDIEVRTNTRVGKDVSVEELEKEFGAILWAIGCKTGRGLFVEGWDETPNCVSGVAYLEAFNKGDLKVTAKKVVCVGGGDTSIDVVSVSRRIGTVEDLDPSLAPEKVVAGEAKHDDALAAKRVPCEATLTALFPREEMTATEEEVRDALHEGVTILNEVMPVALVRDESGRATALRMAKCVVKDGRPEPIEGTEFDLEADLIVSAIGQGGDLTGLEDFDNGRGLMDSDQFYQVPNKPGHFVAGDIVRPHLLTTAIGQGSIAAESIEHYLKNEQQVKRPKVDKHHFDLLAKLKEAGLAPIEFHAEELGDLRGTSEGDWAVHNFEDRAAQEIITTDQMFLGHFQYTPRHKRAEHGPSAEEVLGHFEDRYTGLPEDEAKAEADRCMSCGLCFECDNCVIYCPQDAVYRVPKDKRTTGRYVATDYTRCIGCHICSDVCPTGYIDMAMGE
ncbi:NAD(P)-binding protein [Thiohalobacter sp. IOR34]|uniref:NAD(P)-binding protein n=1 Tax=Thiohalobacter sp. IOR34 TaxID=3057176 RepID=UPI0025B05CEF|nr:NAD(P)-binding protein [Thiohalobacter sp. IOR34]WJW74349.1 NAD(P)-binding protein [Thiohalobacter sp. IOR34]